MNAKIQEAMGWTTSTLRIQSVICIHFLVISYGYLFVFYLFIHVFAVAVVVVVISYSSSYFHYLVVLSPHFLCAYVFEDMLLLHIYTTTKGCTKSRRCFKHSFNISFHYETVVAHSQIHFVCSVSSF